MMYEGYSDYVPVSPALLRLLGAIARTTTDCNLEIVLGMIDKGLDQELLTAAQVKEKIVPVLRTEVAELLYMYGPSEGPFATTPLGKTRTGSPVEIAQGDYCSRCGDYMTTCCVCCGQCKDCCECDQCYNCGATCEEVCANGMCENCCEVEGCCEDEDEED
jgi:hypothetical protein